MDCPKIVSVDDHVVEPPHVWQTWLPERFRERGPRVVRKRWAPFVHHPGAKYTNTEHPDGEWGDAWVYDDKLIYVHKKFVAIPLAATPGGDLSKFDRTQMTMTPVTYDEMRPGCYDPQARVDDFERNWVDGSLPFPTFPRFCGQTFYEAHDKELGLACVARVQRLDGRGMVCAVAWHEHSVVHHAAVGCRARVRRRFNATPLAGFARSASVSCRHASAYRASIPGIGIRCCKLATPRG